MGAMRVMKGEARRAHLRDYLVTAIRDLFSSKAELASLAGLDKLQRTLIEDLCGALADIGFSPKAAGELAAEAVGAALAKKAAKKAVDWLLGK